MSDLKVGIDAISFYSSHYYIALAELAVHRGVKPERFTTSIGQELMAVPPPGEDIVTLAANAAEHALEGIDRSEISTVILATESAIDQSKAAGVFVHKLLDLPSTCRVFETKQACYAATGAIQLCIPRIHQYPNEKILIIASDIARYGLSTPGEATQGGGAVAMLLTANPRLLAFDKESGLYTEDVMDFWRPNYRDEALVDGKASIRIYIKALISSWTDYQEKTGRSYSDFSRFCYHLPFTRMAETAHRKLLKAMAADVSDEEFSSKIDESLIYNSLTGNSYAASLYLGLASLLDNCEDDLSNQRIALFSYGSGCMAEFMSAVVQPGYKTHLKKDTHKKVLENREALSCENYESFYNFESPKDGSNFDFPMHDTGNYRLAKLSDHKRIYEKI
ncbi:MAG: hydroxymethylglutaryl-CoA synthase [Lentisphaeria bacterium]|nr:hydroxymethylglutaryl-CoA synthase [Lentisphaeria bacterium]